MYFSGPGLRDRAVAELWRLGVNVGWAVDDFMVEHRARRLVPGSIRTRRGPE